MAIVGEPTDLFVVSEAQWRQKEQYKGLGVKPDDPEYGRSPETIQYLNNHNAFVKMASSVFLGYLGKTDTPEQKKEKRITDSLAEQRLKSIGLLPDNFMGPELAKKFTIFNGLNELYNLSPRAGIADNADIWNTEFSYGLGGSGYGIQPSPGITNVEVECLNRGSIRRAKISLKAFNKFQFELIEMLYLRVGYHILLEFGNDKYFDSVSDKYTNVRSTLLEKMWFDTNGTTQLEMLKIIKNERRKYRGNYEGFFGRVTNFSWDVTPEGTYDIEIQLHTVGDVIESLQVNLPIGGTTDIELLTSGSNVSLDEKVENVIDAILFNAENKKCSDPDYSEYITLQTIPIEEKDKKPKNPELVNYITFGELLSYLKQYCVPIITNGDNKSNPLINIDTSDNQYMGYHPYQTPLDPRVCIFKIPNYSKDPLLKGIFPPIWNEELQPFIKDLAKDPEKNDPVNAGVITNLYLNFDFIRKCLRQNVGSNGKLSLFKFLQNICNGINSSLGNVNRLEPIVYEDSLISIIDQNPIPGNIESKKDPTIRFESFGYNQANKSASFIKDIQLNTSITPEMATMVTIGATANGGKVKGIDATYFSKWNAGLTDRFQIDAVLNEPSPEALEERYKEELIKKYGEEWNLLLAEEERVVRNNLQRFQAGVDGRAAGMADAFLNTTEKVIEAGKHSVYIKNDPDGLPDDSYTKSQYVLAKLDIYERKKAEEELKKRDDLKFKESYIKYLVLAFGSNKDVLIDNGTVAPRNNKPRYLEYNSTFIGKGKRSYAEFLRVIDKQRADEAKAAAEKIKDLYSSNQIGFIPFNLGITMDGISGIKIYNKIEVHQKLLPDNYPNTLHFIVTKVNHYIRDNKWETQLETIVLPKTKPDKVVNVVLVDDGDGNTLPDDERGPDVYRTDKRTPFEYVENRSFGNTKDDTGPQYLYADVFDSSAGRAKVNNQGYGASSGTRKMQRRDVLRDFHPDIRERFNNFFEEVEEGFIGYYAKINSLYRTPDKTSALNKNKETNFGVSRGDSRHSWAAAIDFNLFLPNGKMLARKGMRGQWVNTGIVDIAKKHKIDWGGEWTGEGEDAVHFFAGYNKETVKSNITFIINSVPWILTIDDIHPWDVKLFRRMNEQDINRIFKQKRGYGYNKEFLYPKNKYR